jgi:hypothetical protein
MASKKPTQAQVLEFEMLRPLLEKLLDETKELSKKKPDAALNKLKVGMINKILERLKSILSNEPIAQYLELLDDETLPTNSDAVYVIAQYETAMDQFRNEHREFDDENEEYEWVTRD